MQIEGLVSSESRAGPDETTQRLLAAIKARGLTLFARVDHAAGAAALGLALRPTQLLMFGNARGGTPLMQAQQVLGVELPLRALVWQDEALRTWVSYTDIAWLARRYALPAATAPVVANIAALLKAVVDQSTGPATLDAELDAELDDTFPASDPLPWSHDSK